MNFEGYQQQITTAWHRGRRIGFIEGFCFGIVCGAVTAGVLAKFVF